MFQKFVMGELGRPAGKKISATTFSFSDQMRKVFVVFVADVFKQLGVRHQTEAVGNAPWPRVRFGASICGTPRKSSLAIAR
jgi:hypothetical protein